MPIIDYNFKYHTKRLTLKFYQLDDYYAWKDAHLSFEKRKNFWDIGPQKEDKLTYEIFSLLVEKYKKRIPTEEMFYLVAFCKDTNKIIGFVFLSDIIRKIFQNAFIGYQVYNNYWRQGYATEMINAAMDIAFNILKLHRIEAAIELKNHQSINLLDKLGFRCEGLCKRRFNFETWTDTLTYAITSEEF
jgi:ribosomal-protein-alanine N-acetyltransferase